MVSPSTPGKRPQAPRADKPKGVKEATPAPPPANAPAEEDEEGEEHMDVAFIQGFADKIQRLPAELIDGVEVSRPKITIPKRGEKDFEPLQETVNLQEMMLQNSRQALFDALQGVRGVAGKSLSHAVITPASPFPQLIVSRGHVLDTLGITVRRATPFTDKPVARVELLPEEVLYMAERGTLQVWNGRDPSNADEYAQGVGAWCDEEFGVKGAIEMSVMELFGRYMGTEGLSWQRYQAYAYLKRLGYTVQRARQFIPEHFLAGQTAEPASAFSLVQAITSLPSRLLRFIKNLVRSAGAALSGLVRVGLGLPARLSRPLGRTALKGWTGSSYASLFAHLRFVPAGHGNPVPRIPLAAAPTGSIYDPLQTNPYLPFFHVWKPVTSWSKVKWDRGSAEGIAQQKPDYIAAVVESRNTPMPTLPQLDEVFALLPDEPKGPVQRVGPQYRKPPTQRSGNVEQPSWLRGQWNKLFKPSTAANTGNAGVNTLRNGDRALIVAVNDSGNTGWVRFGRSGFEAVPMV